MLHLLKIKSILKSTKEFLSADFWFTWQIFITVLISSKYNIKYRSNVYLSFKLHGSNIIQMDHYRRATSQFRLLWNSEAGSKICQSNRKFKQATKDLKSQVRDRTNTILCLVSKLDLFTGLVITRRLTKMTFKIVKLLF